jgi:hypothetical protein
VRLHRGSEISTDHYLSVSSKKLPQRCTKWKESILKTKLSLNIRYIHLLQEVRIRNLYESRFISNCNSMKNQMTHKKKECYEQN